MKHSIVIVKRGIRKTSKEFLINLSQFEDALIHSFQEIKCRIIILLFFDKLYLLSMIFPMMFHTQNIILKGVRNDSKSSNEQNKMKRKR